MKILMCSYFKFPGGCAGAVRHEKLAQMLMSLDYSVLVVGIGPFNGFCEDTYKTIPYTSLRYYSTSFFGKVKTRLLYWRNLKKILGQFQPSVVLMDDMRPYVTEKLKRYTKKHNITLIHDSVEWYSKEQFKRGAFSLAYIKKNMLNRFLINRSCRVIAISQYLTDHFSRKKIPCVNIPVVVSDEDLVAEKRLASKVNFVYAGQAGKKDYLHVVLAAMMLLTKEEQARFTFHIVGCSREQLLYSGIDDAVLHALESSVVIHGRVPRDTVLELLKQADFTILMRSPEQRYAKAGFPTKAVESLSHSTPIIANLTSDLHRYLLDGVNSLVVSDCSPKTLADVLRNAITLSVDERETMCKNAYQTTVDRLHYKHFIPQLKQIL